MKVDIVFKENHLTNFLVFQMKPFIASIDEQNRKTSSCGKLPSNYCYDCESKINVNNISENGNQVPASTLKSPIINDLKPFHRNEVDI